MTTWRCVGVGRAAVLAGVVFLAGGLGGCVSQQDYDRLLVENRTLGNRNAELQSELDECRNAQSARDSSLSAGDSTIAQLRAENSRLQGALDDAQRALNDLDARMRGMSFGPLDAATDAALAQLASQYPQLLQYDSARGMLRFASDLTFDSGSDVVKAEAQQALAALADILKSGAAAQYDLIIVGHTDSQRISAGTAQRHPTNMHLSCHRAISVRNELASMGVAGGKMQAAGWGEERPAVTNASNGNTPQNRRVEVFLGRATGGGAGAADATGSVGVDNAAPPDRQPDPTK